jgi:hypothetical protein
MDLSVQTEFNPCADAPQRLPKLLELDPRTIPTDRLLKDLDKPDNLLRGSVVRRAFEVLERPKRIWGEHIPIEGIRLAYDTLYSLEPASCRQFGRLGDILHELTLGNLAGRPTEGPPLPPRETAAAPAR